MIDQRLKEERRKREFALQQNESRRMLLLGVAGICGFLLIWQLVATLGIIDARYMQSPLSVITALINKITDRTPDGGLLLEHIVSSLKVSLTGYVFAVGIGVPLGLLMGWYKMFDRFLRPLFEVIRPIPAIAWIPVIIISLGIGLEAKAVLVFIAAFIPSLINSYTGIKLTNQVHINVAKTCGASNWATFLHVGIPSALPMVFTGMRGSLGLAWATLVATEMLASNKGLGYMILMGRTYMRVELIMGGMLMIGLIGIAFTGIFDYIERRVLKWRADR